jgi:hypothetical protein
MEKNKMIYNFFKKDNRSDHKKLIDEIDAVYIAKGGKKISDETIRKAEETLKQVYEQGEKTELRLLTELAEELRKEKLVKETADQGYKISDQMTLDSLKSKYEAALKVNGGKRNEDIETLIKDLSKHVY